MGGIREAALFSGLPEGDSIWRRSSMAFRNEVSIRFVAFALLRNVSTFIEKINIVIVYVFIVLVFSAHYIQILLLSDLNS